MNTYRAVGACALALATLAWWWQLPAAAVVSAVGVAVAAAARGFVRPAGDPAAFLRLGSAVLTESDFCRHGIIVGQPGVGKTEFTRRLLIALLRHAPSAAAIMNDEKGDFHRLVAETFAALGMDHRLIVLRPRMFGAAGPAPRHRMNLLGDRRISWQSHAQLVVDTAVSQGQKTSQAHFKIQALDRMAEAMETIHRAGFVVTLPSVYEFFKYPDISEEVRARMLEFPQADAGGSDRVKLLEQGWKQYLAKAPEELSGIRGTVENYTNAYIEPEIAEVFSAVDANVSIADLDAGRSLVFSIPQQFTRARRYIQAYAKILYYRDSLGRFDRAGDISGNLHLGLFDEGHNSLLASEEGFSDFNTLDKMRATRCPVWFALQCYVSALPPLEQESKLQVLKANIGTHIIFRLASEKGCKLASGVVGEHEVLETSYSVNRGVTTVTRTPKVKPVLGTWVFRRLRDFHAIIRHPTDVRYDFHQAHLPPLTADGRRIARWYWHKMFLG